MYLLGRVDHSIATPIKGLLQCKYSWKSTCSPKTLMYKDQLNTIKGGAWEVLENQSGTTFGDQ